ncbi:MAG TPA: hydroxymethylglutaryl-CoA lyase [Pseudomonadota bacterium]|nr:hydroxymethylglutaryl-CoA lyase [Pseudomonadota bacterium]HNF99512.1 hydroxymethylglutaryl-CoA lyase [Pseudomonadota bacterium]HNI58635.1 hydroxymethylglutaryl-CoA lyase [Pseudomonadota bacterium]HNK45950.1 hydroxymethylglutaryl-CoA lyase [Pseudomonadota bacterium]HNN51084.1 hydroxymethylglutaryl-CoA lyase [Pseudomonadota bacterium]
MAAQSQPSPLFASLPARVTVYEVGPRDGLQNEQRMVPTADKIALINALSQTGLSRIEVSSFVNPKWIPQLADASEVARGITRRPGVEYSCLVPNRRGLDSALAVGLKEIAVFMSASETHNKKNINKTRADTLLAFGEVMQPALQAGVRVRAYISTVYGCPYEGRVSPDATVELVETLLSMGAYQISLGDTIGVATPRQVEEVLLRLDPLCSRDKLALHFHDTRGTALANVLVGLQMGITTIDSALGGLGGCPYAPGASGNLATEDLIYMLDGMGVETGINLDALVDCSRQVGTFIGRELPSKYLKAHLAARSRSQV